MRAQVALALAACAAFAEDPPPMKAAFDRDALLDALEPIVRKQIAARDTGHPVFHGCVDWHSAVHGHWALLRIARATGRHDAAAEAADRSMSAEGIAKEATFLRDRPDFEMPYGRAWFLLLAEEFERRGDEKKTADPSRLRAMAGEVAASLEAHFGGRPPDPDDGEYDNPSWALLRLYGWYAFVEDEEGLSRVAKLVDGMKGLDTPAAGFAADLGRSEFFSRFGNYATLVATARPEALAGFLESRPIPDDALRPIQALPTVDHQLGLNWSRAWALKKLAAAAPGEDDRKRYRAAYEAHVVQAWKHHAAKAGDVWAYDHWVPQFAVYALTQE
jgi:hypothetical protein